MYKDELLALWNGINWKETVGGIYFTSHKLAKEVQFSFTGYKEENLSDIKDSLMIKLSTELETLDNFALQIIKEKLDDKRKNLNLQM